MGDQLTLTLVAAVVGGLAGGLGTWFVDRRQHIREQRVRLLTVLLPPVTVALERQNGPHYSKDFQRDLTQLAYGALTVKREAPFGAGILGALRQRSDGLSKFEPVGYPESQVEVHSDAGLAQATQAHADISKAIKKLEQHLRRRLSGRAR
jgi:hypothetical protein